MPTLNVTACAFALMLLAPAPDAPRFVCKEGVTVQRTLEMQGSRELTKFTLQSGGETMDRDDIHRTISLSSKAVVKDEVRACAAERITTLARTYVTLEKSRTEKVDAAGKESTTEVPETSDLTDKTVVFTWDADLKAYARTIDGKADEDLTADLDVEMDYRAFLPKSDAEAGAKWDVDFADVKMALLRPGGDIPFKAATEPKAMDKRLRKAAWEATKGKLSLELGAEREADGHKVVTITFEGDMSYDATGAPEGDEKGPTRVRIEDAQKIEGKLVWNLDAGRAESIEWTAKGTIKLTIGAQAKREDGTDVELEQIQSFDEEYTYTGSFETQ